MKHQFLFTTLILVNLLALNSCNSCNKVEKIETAHEKKNDEIPQKDSFNLVGIKEVLHTKNLDITVDTVRIKEDIYNGKFIMPSNNDVAYILLRVTILNKTSNPWVADCGVLTIGDGDQPVEIIHQASCIEVNEKGPNELNINPSQSKSLNWIFSYPKKIKKGLINYIPTEDLKAGITVADLHL